MHFSVSVCICHATTNQIPVIKAMRPRLAWETVDIERAVSVSMKPFVYKLKNAGPISSMKEDKCNIIAINIRVP